MNIKTFLSAFLLSLITFTAQADAIEDAIRAGMAKNFPEVKIETITKTAYGNLYEIFAGSEIFYTDAKASFVVLGNIIEPATRQNVTEARLQKLTAIKFDELPLEMAFKTVRGDGSKRIAIFADPNCGYCKRFETDLLEISNITIYTFLYPILAADSSSKSKQVWCAADRTKSWQNWMIRGVALPTNDVCDNPVEKVFALGQKLRINGTPTTYFENGEHIPGALPKDQFLAKLETASVKPSAKN